MKVLIVIDMQNDFIDGSLGTKEALAIVDAGCCACVSPESHKTALASMKLCPINVIGEE